MDAKHAEELGRGYDLVEMIWNEGQPPDIDWRVLGAMASELADVAQRLNEREGRDR